MQDDEEKKEETQRKTESSWTMCLLESLVIIVMIGLIPVSFILTEVIFNYNDADDYKLFFAIPRDTSVTQNEMYLDNIRLLYEE